MSYRVKDYNKTLLAEHETFEDFSSYVSSSLIEIPELLYFEYDTDIYERIESGSLVPHAPSLELVRITYSPLHQDDVDLAEE